MAVGLKKMGKPSPFKIAPWIAANPMAAMGIAQAGIGILGGLIGGKKRRREQREAREAMEASRQAYMQQEYTNPYENLENPYEDLTVNQQQAQFQAQQGAQQRADILGGLRGTAGGAGVAGLAQAMAQQSTLQTQQISASIGQQETRNQELRARGAMGVQRLERYGESIRQGKEEQRIATLYGMDMGRLTAANKARQQARSQMISGIGAGLGTVAQGIGMGETPWAKVGGNENITANPVNYTVPTGTGPSGAPLTTPNANPYGTEINIEQQYDIYGNPIQQIPSPFNKRKSK